MNETVPIPQQHILQVNANSPRAEENYPVDLTIRQFRQMKSFRLPAVERRGDRTVYFSTERSVDFCPVADIDSNSTVLVSISTTSSTPVAVSAQVVPLNYPCQFHFRRSIFASSLKETRLTGQRVKMRGKLNH